MTKIDFIRIGVAFIFIAALIAFINLESDFEAETKLNGIISALPVTFGLLGLIKKTEIIMTC
ncbi:hypothetical protein HUO40_004119 [Salmonella enterica]|nr:hypothetical protein [Salmonella enterica]